MTSSSGAARVCQAPNSVSGIEQVAVDLATGEGTVHFASSVPLEMLYAALENFGCEVRTEAFSLCMDGMTSACCLRRVREGLIHRPGVLEASVASLQGRYKLLEPA